LGLIVIGDRLLKILSLQGIKFSFKEKQVFYGQVEAIKIDNVNIKSITNDEIIAYTTINMQDSNANYFPMSDIGVKNFLITETSGSVTQEVDILKVESLAFSGRKFNLIVMIDCSSSMKEKLDESKKIVKKLLSKISGLKPNVAIYKITGENSEKGWLIDDIWAKPDLFLKETDNPIDNIKAEGKTPLWSSIEEALNVADKRTIIGNKMIICLTDGKNYPENADEFNVLLKKITSLNIPILSVKFGAGDENMEKISTKSGAGGKDVGYFDNTSIKTLENVFDRIADIVTKTYTVFWKPIFKQGDGEVSVNLQVSFKNRNDELKEGKYSFTYLI
jgi:Mg-chelatase subunit ChlD